MVTDRCAQRSRGWAEQAFGTASRARRWVLFEQPGSWGRDALDESALPPDVRDRLRLLARELPARVLLLRRTGGGRPSGSSRSLFVGRSDAAGGWLERIGLEHPRDLLDLDLHGIASGVTVHGERLRDPLYLVCTNGKHDPCCAEYGLPVARALDTLVEGRVWECSHVGGDRFAGNLVCLPDGIFYGHLDPADARRAVAAHEDGRMLLDRLRGRSSLPFAVQAAETLVRQELGLERLDAVRFTGADRTGRDHLVRFDLNDGRILVATVREGRGPARRLTCGEQTSQAPTYELLALDTTPSG